MRADKYSFTVPDTVFEMLFDRFNGETPGFLERYNFTIREDSPFDQEVAVDPEMIGKVYENLVNITFEGIEEEDLRGTAGIFYTPRIEIDLMCRLALVDWLANHSPVIFMEIEEATERMIRPELRVCTLRQRELYEEGLPTSDEEGRKRILVVDAISSFPGTTAVEMVGASGKLIIA